MIYKMIVDGVVKLLNVMIISNGDLLIFNLIEIVNFRKYYGFDYEEDCE